MSRASAAVVVALLAACGVTAPTSRAPQPAAAHAPALPPGTSTRPDPRAVNAAPEPEPPALRLSDDVVPTSYRVRWVVDADRDAFTGHVDIDVDVRRATDHVWLNAVGLAITAPSYTQGGADRPLAAIGKRTDDVVGFRLAAAAAPGPLTVHLDFAGKSGLNEFAGLFREIDTGRTYLYSQFESSFARRAVPSFDEPRWKTPWTVTLVVPAGQQAFSNTPVREVRPHPDGSRDVEFEPTPPLPSYLVAIAVGPFETVDAGRIGKTQVPARIVVPAGHVAETMYAARETGAVVAALEDYFDMPLPLAKLDLVAVPQFFGAMENPGLITFQSSILLAAPGHDGNDFRHQFLWIAGHELAHQWFGDLVTLAWWDDLWLNESFATWMADKVGERLDPHWDAAIRNADETEKAMQADAMPGSRPLHREIRAASDIEGSFDAIAYEKGGAVLSMFERWVGPDRFRAGVRTYLAAHARGTATAGDFLSAIAGVASPEVRDAFSGFLDQAGVPLVRVTLRCDAGAKPILALTQERLGDPAATTRWKVPMCVRWWAHAGAPAAERCALLDGATGTFELDATSCPEVVDANAGAAGYYRVAYDPALGARIIKHLAALAPAERLGLAGDTAALVDTGDLDLGRALELARALLGHRDPHAQLAAVDLIARTGALVDDAHRAAWQRWVIAQLGARARKVGFAPALGADEVSARARDRLLQVDGAVAADPQLGAEARRLADAWLSGRKMIDPDDLDLVLEVAAVRGDAALFDRISQAALRSHDADEVSALVGAIASFRDPALVERAIGLFIDGSFDLRTAGRIIEGMFAHPETQERAWAVLEARFDAAVARLPRFVAGYIALTASGFCDAAHRKDADDFLRPRVTKLAGGERSLGQALAQVDRCIALRARNADAVARWFAK
jgi:aminopeptidase N